MKLLQHCLVLKKQSHPLKLGRLHKQAYCNKRRHIYNFAMTYDARNLEL